MPVPNLLVSVRNSTEATAAVRGGADIIDVKEPHNGPLGFAGPAQIKAVLDAVAGQRPVSAALGETVDWLAHMSVQTHDNHPTTATHNSPLAPTVLNRLCWIKMGLSGLVNHDIPDNNDASAPACDSRQSTLWTSQWQTARNRCISPAAHSASNACSWVAVAYADYAASRSPSPEDILNRAAPECSVLLVDTFSKTAQSSIRLLGVERLVRLRDACQHAGLRFALAGRVTLGELAELRQISPDIIAVRGAVCSQGNRTHAVAESLVDQFRAAIHRRFGDHHHSAISASLREPSSSLQSDAD